MDFNSNQDYWSCVFSTDKFLSIETYSGLGRIAIDPLFPPHLLEPGADDKEIGESVLKALANSRTLNNVEERIKFFDINRSKEKHASWVANLMENYQYKTKRSLFSNMKKCGIHLKDEIITIRPSYHEKLEAWSGERIPETDYVILTTNSPVEDIGAGLRLALSRCTG